MVPNVIHTYIIFYGVCQEKNVISIDKLLNL